MSIDPAQYRQVLGRFATGIAIVTCLDRNGRRAAMTINSFTSLSIDPPLVLWNIDRKSDQYDAFDGATHVAINILAEHQQPVSDHFATPSDDKFGTATHRAGHGGAPLIDDVCATLQCRIANRFDGGDHIIVIGEVLDLDACDSPPLIYHGGRYRVLA
jgi:flavin reductase (DIM6/NTAB) family NADH-FMN oxidoreductase RutF